MAPRPITRRKMLQTTSLAAGSMFLPLEGIAATSEHSPVRFGVIADVHKDVMHDANERLQAFIDEATAQQVDFVLQLGDFCCPIPENESFMQIWNAFDGPRYHVLGNHDTDGGFKREETVAYWKMTARYYSFDVKDCHVVVLDGNDQGPGQQPYYRFILDDQLKWFADDLDATDRTTIVFVHQSPERPESGGIENGKQVQQVMQDANRKAGRRKVVACFTGHHHRDYMRRLGGILYPQINSASYYWLGGDYLTVRYSEEIDKSHPYIKYTVPYEQPLFAIVTLDTSRGVMEIAGRNSKFVGPSPWDLGASREKLEARSLVPTISDWKTPI